ncbi:MAG: hypothetical protein SNJ60_04815 [Pseudanabaenaceae cyanobacterium]
MKPPHTTATRRPDIYSWVLVALMLFSGTASGTIAYNYGRRALDVVREVPAGSRSFRSRRSSAPRPTETPAPASPENADKPATEEAAPSN